MAKYSIKQLETGFDPAFPAGIAFDMWNMAGESAYSPFSVTLIQGEGHNILFDCGFDPDSEYAKVKIAQENDQNCHNTAEVLNANGISPDDIDTVVISHCHWDHLQGLKYFKNAAIYIQKDEFENWDRVMKDPGFPVTHKMVIDPECMKLLKKKIEDGSVRMLDGSVKDFLPGIDIVTAKGHSFCQNMLYVNSNGTHYAICGDVAMRPESFLGTDAFPCFLPNLKFSVGTIEDIISSYDSIVKWVDGKIENIVLSHDGTAPEKRKSECNSLGLRAFDVA